MKSLKDILAVLVGLASAAGAIWYFYKFVTFSDPQGGHSFGWISLALDAVAVIRLVLTRARSYISRQTSKRRFVHHRAA